MISMLSAWLIAYTACWSGARMMGQGRMKSASSAIFPSSIFAILFYLNRMIHFDVLLSMSFIIISFIYLIVLSKYKWIPSVISTLFSLNICVSGQLSILVFQLDGYEKLLVGIILYGISCILWNKNSSVFKEQIVVTNEQKKDLKGIMWYLFLGPIILFVWNIYVLFNSYLWNCYILLFDLIFLILVYFMLYRLMKEMQEHIENLMDKQYQKEVFNFMQVIRSQRHDFNFHMQTVYGMLEKEQYLECQNYIHSMLSIVQSSNDILPIENPAISALLNTFQEIAHQKGLKLEVEIHDNLSNLPCTVYEINTVLGNLIQNAIDELERNTEGSRIIHVLIIKRGNNNMIKVSNYCHKSVEEMKDIFTPGYTTKPKHEGLGLSNASKMVEKYNGVVYPEFEDHMIHMIARIPMKY